MNNFVIPRVDISSISVVSSFERRPRNVVNDRDQKDISGTLGKTYF